MSALCFSHNPIVLVIFVPKIITVGRNENLTKSILLHFL